MNSKRSIVLCVVALMLCGMVIPTAQGVTVGAKAWYATLDGENDVSMIILGPTISVDLPGEWWLSSAFLYGKFTDFDLTELDAELIVAYSFASVDVGTGIRVTRMESDWLDESELSYGPMLYVAAGGFFGDSSGGWYAGGSVMPADLGDAEGQHLVGEVGLSYTTSSIQSTVGLRYKKHFEWDSSFIGPAASITASF